MAIPLSLRKLPKTNFLFEADLQAIVVFDTEVLRYPPNRRTAKFDSSARTEESILRFLRGRHRRACDWLGRRPRRNLIELNRGAQVVGLWRLMRRLGYRCLGGERPDAHDLTGWGEGSCRNISNASLPLS